MSLPINSAGNELQRLMTQLGYSGKTGDLIGTALDRTLATDPALARNLRDVFADLSPSRMDRAIPRGRMSDPGFTQSPREAYQQSSKSFGNSYYSRERIHTHTIATDASGVIIGGKHIDLGGPTNSVDFEKRLLTEPGFRRDIEKQLGGRIILDGDADGKISVAKHHEFPGLKGGLRGSRVLQDLLNRLKRESGPLSQYPPRAGGPVMYSAPPAGYQSASSPIVRDHRTQAASQPIVRDHRTESVSQPVVRDHRTDSNVVVRDHRSQGASGPIVRDHRSAPPAALPPSPVLENLDNFVRTTNPETYNTPTPDGQDISSILHDPSLSFEEKLALFMFAFLEKKQKTLEKKMEDLDKQQQQGDKKDGGGGGILGTIGKIGGGIIGGVYGGPGGAAIGSEIGGQVGGAVDGAVNGGDGANGADGQGKDSNQIAMMKLNKEFQEMDQMFSLVDNMLKSMNDVVKQGPLAAIRG